MTHSNWLAAGSAPSLFLKDPWVPRLKSVYSTVHYLLSAGLKELLNQREADHHNAVTDRRPDGLPRARLHHFPLHRVWLALIVPGSPER